MIKARISGDNENAFHWKYLLSKKNRVKQQNAPTLAEKKGLATSSMKPWTYVLKKVSVTALN